MKTVNLAFTMIDYRIFFIIFIFFFYRELKKKIFKFYLLTQFHIV